MKPTRDRPLWFARSVICLLGVLALSLPAQALADVVEPGEVGDVVEEVTETVDEVADEVTEGAGDAVEEVTEGAGDAVEEVTEGAGDAVEEVTDGAGDAVEEVTDAVDGAVDGATDGAGSAVEGVAATPGETVGSNPLAPSDGHGGDGVGAEPGPPTTEPGEDRIGSPVPVGGAHLMRPEVDGSYFWWEFEWDVLGMWVPSAQTVEPDAGSSDEDACNDVELVCLGLLYGLGDFANTQTQVLSFLATTGIGVLGLMVLAVGLGIAGSMALVGSRYGSAATAGRAG